MKFYWLVLAGLAVWRVAHLLAAEDGPGKVLRRLRDRWQGGVLGILLDCLDCVSLWVALPVAFVIGDSLRERVLLWPALSAEAMMLDRAMTWMRGSPVYYAEDEERDDAMLRKEREAGRRDTAPPAA